MIYDVDHHLASGVTSSQSRGHRHRVRAIDRLHARRNSVETPSLVGDNGSSTARGQRPATTVHGRRRTATTSLAGRDGNDHTCWAATATTPRRVATGATTRSTAAPAKNKLTGGRVTTSISSCSRQEHRHRDRGQGIDTVLSDDTTDLALGNLDQYREPDSERQRRGRRARQWLQQRHHGQQRRQRPVRRAATTRSSAATARTCCIGGGGKDNVSVATATTSTWSMTWATKITEKLNEGFDTVRPPSPAMP